MIPHRSLCCLLLGTLACFGSSAPAQEANEGEWTLTPSYVSQYIFRGVRLAGSSFQPGAEYARGDWLAGIWGSCPLQSEGTGPTPWELDFYGSYTRPLISEQLDLVAGATLYAFPNSHRSAGAYPVTIEPSVALNATVKGIRFTPKVYYDLMLDGPTAELSATFALPLKSLGTELDFLASVGTFRTAATVAGARPEVKNWGDYWLASVTLPYQVSANGRVAVGLTYSEGHHNFFKAGTDPRERNEDAVNRLFVSISYSVSL